MWKLVICTQHLHLILLAKVVALVNPTVKGLSFNFMGRTAQSHDQIEKTGEKLVLEGPLPQMAEDTTMVSIQYVSSRKSQCSKRNREAHR